MVPSASGLELGEGARERGVGVGVEYPRGADGVAVGQGRVDDVGAHLRLGPGQPAGQIGGQIGAFPGRVEGVTGDQLVERAMQGFLRHGLAPWRRGAPLAPPPARRRGWGLAKW